jgi:L-lactate dehydrogenase complex protein LldF
VRAGLRFWGFFAARPRLYGLATAAAARLLSFLGKGNGRFRWLPLASSWTRYRDFPAPQGTTFQSQWKARRKT